LEKAKDNAKWAKMMAVKEQYFAEREQKRKEDLKRVLEGYCGVSQESWVKLLTIIKAFNQLGYSESSKSMARLLRKNGFTEIQRRGGGYFYVLVNVEKTKMLGPSSSLGES
jgi:hypothetical protein